MNKRILIHNAAIKIISKNGFYNAKIQDIVNDANISVGSFYNYFSDKNNLLYYIFESRLKSLIKKITEISLMKISPLSQVETYFNFLNDEDPELKSIIKEEYWVFNRSLSEDKNKEFTELNKELEMKFITIIKNGQSLNIIKNTPPLIIYHLLNSITSKSFNEHYSSSLDISYLDDKIFFMSTISSTN